MGAPGSNRGLVILVVLVIILVPVILFPPASLYLRKCGRPFSPLNISGSTAFYPLVQQAKLAYKNENALCFLTTINVTASSSTDGLDAAHLGQVDIGTSDLFADPTDPAQSGLQDHQIAIVVFALVIHKEQALSTITNLQTRQIQSIYGGAYQSWHDLNASIDPTLKINLVSRPFNSGTRATFDQYVLRGLENVSGSQVGDTNEQIAQYVCHTSDSIGYISLYYYYEHQNCLQYVLINGFDPMVGVTSSNLYTFWNIEHMYTRGEPNGLTREFIAYMYGNTVKQYFKQDGYLSISDIPPDMLNSHLLL